MISEIIEKWIKGILIDGITGNLSGLFDNVNAKVGEIASDVGSTPQAWNSGIFNMLRSLSETVVLPIAAAILALVMCHELMPILSDLHQALLDQHLPEADRVAQALDLYVSGSLNVFNHKTNVDIHNRLVAFDIKELGKQLKKLGMLIIQDQIWGRVTQNRSQGRATWYFADEFHLLLKEEQTAAYSAEIWKRFRKWGGVPTGATQNVKDLLSSPEIENILENSDFITLLNQASGDRKILSERLNLSADQQKYIDNSEPGEGLLIFENVVLPFTNPIPKNTELYKIMTTRLDEVPMAEKSTY